MAVRARVHEFEREGVSEATPWAVRDFDRFTFGHSIEAANPFPDNTPQFFMPPASGTAVNGLTIFSWAEAAAQLTRKNASWSAAQGAAAVVTYAFRSTAPGTMPDDASGFSRFSAAQILAAEAALQLWSDVANITFVRVGSGTSGEGAYSNSGPNRGRAARRRRR